jgi:uncharacterized membrane protein
MSTLDLLTFVCAVGSGLVAGFFFAFSVCVMWGLGKLPSAHGVSAMQTINLVLSLMHLGTVLAAFGAAVAFTWALRTPA